MLHLVPPPRADGQDPPAKRRKGARSPCLFLTAEEARHVRAAARNAARAYGGLDVLALVIGMPPESLGHALSKRRRPSGIIAIRLAKAAGVSVETVLTGTLNAAGRCATCGHRAGDGRLAAGGGAR